MICPSKPNSGGNTVRNTQAYTLKNTIWKIELNATSPAPYWALPPAS